MRRLFFAITVLGIILGDPRSALADFETAGKQYAAMTEEQKATLTLSLIATGDFNGLYSPRYSKALHGAIESFQTREGFPPTGILTPEQQESLRKRAESFLRPLGLKQYAVGPSGASLLVPRALFDSELSYGPGYSFEREDGTLSLVFEHYSGEQTPFKELYKRFTTSSGGRKVTYSTLQPQYFVSSGTYRGRFYYSWVSIIPSGL